MIQMFKRMKEILMHSDRLKACMYEMSPLSQHWSKKVPSISILLQCQGRWHFMKETIFFNHKLFISALCESPLTLSARQMKWITSYLNSTKKQRWSLLICQKPCCGSTSIAANPCEWRHFPPHSIAALLVFALMEVIERAVLLFGL